MHALIFRYLTTRTKKRQARFFPTAATILGTNPSIKAGTLRLTVSPVALSVEALPGLSPASSGLVVSVALVETTGLLAGGGETAQFTVLVDGVNDPVDASIAADSLVLGVDEDDLKVLVGRVLVDPVGV